MTNEMDEVCGRVFLREQLQLVPKPVVESIEEAIEFLEDCYATVFDSKQELIEFVEEESLDIDVDALDEVLEVFALPDGRYLYVEA